MSIWAWIIVAGLVGFMGLVLVCGTHRSNWDDDEREEQ